VESNLPAEERQRFPALAESFRRAKKLGTSEIRERMWREAEIPPPPPPDPSRRDAEVEELTAVFRADLAREHRTKTREARALMRECLDHWYPLDVEPGAHAFAVKDSREVLSVPASLLNPELLHFQASGFADDEARSNALREEMWAATRRAKWHEGRDRGQQKRFDTYRSCGERIVVPNCSMCGRDGKPIPEGCGVSRLCERCSLYKGKARRARFGRGRGRALLLAARKGLTRKVRTNGRFSEKMLTLTVPHVTRAECTGPAFTKSRDDVSVRVAAAYLAWPIFLRKVNYHLSGDREENAAKVLRKEAAKLGDGHLDPATGIRRPLTRAGERRLKRAARLERKAGQRRLDRPYTAYHRAFEWTAGDDGFGHPHFHVYFWSTFLPGERLHAWWATSLRKVGLTIGTTRCTKTTKTMRDGQIVDAVVVELRMLRGFNHAAVFELMKGGKRSALELSRLDFEHGTSTYAPVGMSGAVFMRGPGVDAMIYAEGWTIGGLGEMCSPEIRAMLYMALEGRRLSQASRGFFVDDEPCMCTNCGASAFTVQITTPELYALQKDRPGHYSHHERGPP
jgi:hypothetical protein